MPTASVPPDEIAELRNTYREEPKAIATFRDYAKGKQPNSLTEKQKEILRGIYVESQPGRTFCANVCKVIIDEARDRLKFTHWTCEDANVQAELADFYTSAMLETRQNNAHKAALRDGNHAYSLAWSESSQRVKLFRENWWDGEGGVYIAYDDTDEIIWACKDWSTKVDGKPALRRVVHYDDRIERFVSMDSGQTWNRFQLPGDTAWPEPWVKTDGSPLNVPYIHLANSEDEEANYGTSELDGGITGFQDQLNDLHWAMSGCGRLTGYQMYVLRGVPKAATPAVGPGEVWIVENPAGGAEVLAAGDPDALIKLYDLKEREMALASRTPVHRITGQWPSGEAIIQATMPSVGKAKGQISRFKPAYVMLGHRYVEIRNRFSTEAALNEDLASAKIEAHFEAPERRDPLTMAAIVKQLEHLLPATEQLKLFGFSEDDAKRIADEKTKESEAEMERQATAFSRGLGPGTQLPGRGAPPEPDAEQ